VFCFPSCIDLHGSGCCTASSNVVLYLDAFWQKSSIERSSYFHIITGHEALTLYFCYRWVLILFKREVTFEGAQRLWEALWARPQDHLHLYAAVALLSRLRRQILEEDLGFDGILELCVGLAGHVSVDQMLRDAEMLRAAAGEEGELAVAGLDFGCTT
jgi:hypothetical protein